jgi:hypothetical protein
MFSYVLSTKSIEKYVRLRDDLSFIHIYIHIYDLFF